MKKKVFNKKLSLNKETVSKLNEVEMMNVKGGIWPTESDEEYQARVDWYVGTRNTCGC